MHQSLRSGHYDLVCVGGGPAGTMAAGIVARAGGRVLLLEQAKFPRHRIGESLLPSSIHYFLRLLGAKERVEAAGFQKKFGATWVWGKEQEPWTMAFSDQPSLGETLGYSYQVERSKFDQLLLQHVADLGVEVHTETVVTGLTRDCGRVTGVTAKKGGNEFVVPSRFVINAAGGLSRLAGPEFKREYSEFFNNMAIYGYFRNCGRLNAGTPQEGNIVCCAIDNGWLWFIPLRSDLTSIGLVINKDSLAKEPDTQKTLIDAIKRSKLISSLMDTAEMVDDDPDYSQIRIVKDYSYTTSTFYSNGLAIVGDAACFIDPVFSSGVHLAQYGGLLAGRSVNSCLAGVCDEKSAFSEFEVRYRQEFSNFFRFLVSFYDANKTRSDHFWHARSILQTNEQANHAFLRLVSGISIETGGEWEQSLTGNIENFPLVIEDSGLKQVPYDPSVAVSSRVTDDHLYWRFGN